MNKTLFQRSVFLLLGFSALSVPPCFADAPQKAVGRTFNFVNQCPFPVWFGFISGATGSTNGGKCATDADCLPGSTCVNRGGGDTQCFFKNPVPANGNYQLSANGGTNSVTIPAFDNQSIVWSGAVAGRTKCTATGCQTADCGNGTGGCPAGKGFVQPATQAEFTLSLNGTDFYDVEVINGFNLPVSMSPNMTLHDIQKACKGPNCDTPYFCGNPGSPYPATQTGRCSWAMVPPSIEYRWVTAGGDACTSDSTCTSPNVCGLSFNPGNNPLLKKTCGKIQGYWTANQVCGVQGNYGMPFNCQLPLPAPQQNLTLKNLYACTQVGSCYQDGAPNTCCGCANWDKVGANVPAGPYTEQCKNSNVAWTANVLNTLLWLKKACPTAYTYPYDDMSSTFTCKSAQSGQNTVSYTITYCPGGLTGGVSA